MAAAKPGRGFGSERPVTIAGLVGKQSSNKYRTSAQAGSIDLESSRERQVVLKNAVYAFAPAQGQALKSTNGPAPVPGCNGPSTEVGNSLFVGERLELVRLEGTVAAHG
jgi:hypothetical protein